MKSLPIYLALLLLILPFVNNAQEENECVIYSIKEYTFPYELTKPVKKTHLPSELREVSGIVAIDNNRIACIQDEKGNIYIVDFNSGEIEKKIDFGESGDYEGLAVVDDNAWVLKSNGNLYRVKNFLGKKDDRKTRKYETDLSKKNDVEGLCADTVNNRLLLACKGHPFIEDRPGKDYKAIYEFDLKEKQLNPEPIHLIDLDYLKDLKKYNTLTQLGLNILGRLDENKGDLTFQPSDLAVHPQTGHLYVIGAVGDLLLVYSKLGTLLAVVDLNDKDFKQAEGISFLENGDLYISNEGGDGRANILLFRPTK